MPKLAKGFVFCEFDQSLLSPHVFFAHTLFFLRLKKGKIELCSYASLYARFLSINRASTIATTMIKTNKPAIAGTKYMSATDVGVDVGVTVAP